MWPRKHREEKSMGESDDMAQVRSAGVYIIGVFAMMLLCWMFLGNSTVPDCKDTSSRKESFDELSDGNIMKIADAIESRIVRNTHLLKNDSKEADKWDYNWDKRAGKTWPSETRTLVLVRHGQYDFATGHLTDIGKKQAYLTGERLKQMGFQYSKIVHSSMIRAQETATAIQKHLEGTKQSEDDGIREGGPIPPSPTITYWRLADKDYHVDGPRLEASFRKYFFRADPAQRQSTVDILVAHGNILRYFMLRALQLEPAAWMRVFIPHASISVFECNRDSTVTMTKFGDSGHLPVNMVTY